MVGSFLHVASRTHRLKQITSHDDSEWQLAPEGAGCHGHFVSPDALLDAFRWAGRIERGRV
eukprot:CAMPEP_0203894432 /NCGR_PEP_ID=MMETSP0359-20131031/37394_1 /ASSEMBLY_ACC=CAM_ASM_000338 /TAXON_ID=268821 /ORGANISM="Scrippsiella Hangoei, Strain SHTV-5" /LENGTH=60 /DNA_ID=CAMNT_0050816727 /DNA_START=52 /DNA_END=234 /DNA_ORIENTATION=+